MKAISYSLFGIGERFENSFEFSTYLRGLGINVRMNRLLYPDWKIVLNTDRATNEVYGHLFNDYGIEVWVHDNAPLTLAMLWRLKPCFSHNFTHVICRDLDSPSTARELKCVLEWVESGKIAHAITDSISHTIPMMGGMIGFQPGYFMERMSIDSWDNLIQLGSYDWRNKGTDQTFLNNHIYPVFARPESESIMQHYLLGMPNTFLSGYRNEVPNIEIDPKLEQSNDSCGHIGAAGFYEGACFKFFNQFDCWADIIAAEKAYPKIFNWND